MKLSYFFNKKSFPLGSHLVKEGEKNKYLFLSIKGFVIVEKKFQIPFLN